MNTALIVNGDNEIQHMLETASRRMLPGWEIQTVHDLEKAMKVIPQLSDLRAAIVSLHLAELGDRRGLEVLRAIEDCHKGCRKILVAPAAKRWSNISSGDPVDEFIPLIYESGEEPQSLLEGALSLAQKHSDFPDGKKYERMT